MKITSTAIIQRLPRRAREFGYCVATTEIKLTTLARTNFLQRITLYKMTYQKFLNFQYFGKMLSEPCN